jgi:AcrR family transcriptional regulator
MAQRRAGRREAERRTSDERWQAILAAGSRVFRRLGYQQATLEDVAQEVGINRATLYYYVADKAELLISMLDEPVHKMTRDLRDVVASEETAEQKLRMAIEHHMQALDENYPELFVFLAENTHLMTIGRDRDIQRNAREYGTLMTSIIIEGIAQGEFRDDLDPRLVMLGIVGMMNWSHRWYRPTGPHSLLTIAKQFEEMLLDGLLVRRTRRRR